MGVSKRSLKAGNGIDRVKAGDTVTMSYTGYLRDTSKAGGKGRQFDSSAGRGDFTAKVGGGKLIKGMSHISRQSSRDLPRTIVPGSI